MRRTLTKNFIDQATAEAPRHLLVWDTKVTGLGLRVTPAGAKSFVFQYRSPDGRDRRTTLGRFGTQLTLQQARKLAAEKRLEVAAGGDPVGEQRAKRAAPTVRDLHQRFMVEHAPKRKASTQRNYRMLWDNYLLPALGSKPVEEVTWQDIDRLHYQMRDTPYMANRMLALVSKAWGLAARWGWWPRDRANPGRDHDTNPELRRGRALESEELQRLGEALDAEGNAPSGAAVRTCLLVGCRPKEMRTLRWQDLHDDGRRVELPESKTGPRSLFLGRPAVDIITRQARISEYVFPGRDLTKPMYDLKAVWYRVKDRAELEAGIRLYDACRHTFTTQALELGIPLDRVKLLIGHTSGDTTARYTHYRTSVLQGDADRVAERINGALEGTTLQR